jgi:ketosteroid isomerase-like protein
MDSPAITSVREAFEAFARRDLAGLVRVTDPEVELFVPTAVLANERRCYRGHGGIARYIQDVVRVWRRLEVIPESFREVGHHVVVIGRVRAEGRDGFHVDSPAAWVWELRDGRLRWGCVYDSPGRLIREPAPVPGVSAAAPKTLADGVAPTLGAA